MLLASGARGVAAASSRHRSAPKPTLTSPAAAASARSSLVFSRSHKKAHSSRRVVLRAQQDTEFELAVPLWSPQGSQLAQILSSGEGNDRVLFDPAVKVYLQELQQEREMEQQMEAEAAADAAAEAAAAAAEAAAAASTSSNAGGEASTSSSEGATEGDGYDVADSWDDSALMKRIRALREAERGQVVADVIYLSVCRKLLAEPPGLQLLSNVALLSPAVSQPPGTFISKQKLARSNGLLSPAVVDAVLSYMASTFDGGDPELMGVASPAATPLSVDRVQAARLYAGLLEIGYFAQALEAACIAADVPVGDNSASMLAFADKLPEEKLRRMCAVQTADGWWSAVRHIGNVFGLKPNNDPFDSLGLPYPDLSVTISQIQMEPAASMWEHYNTPGSTARLAAKSADKMARGWSGSSDAEGGLPDADLLAFEFGLFQRMLLEAAVFGACLYNVEQHLESEYGYTLSARKDREEQANAPPM